MPAGASLGRFGSDLTLAHNEPVLALAGFDKIKPRRALGGKFGRVVDAGLGAGPTDYLDILIHAFPSPLATRLQPRFNPGFASVRPT